MKFDSLESCALNLTRNFISVFINLASAKAEFIKFDVNL